MHTNECDFRQICMSYAISADSTDQSPCMIVSVCGSALDSVEDLYILPQLTIVVSHTDVLCCQLIWYIGLKFAILSQLDISFYNYLLKA